MPSVDWIHAACSEEDDRGAFLAAHTCRLGEHSVQPGPKVVAILSAVIFGRHSTESVHEALLAQLTDRPAHTTKYRSAGAMASPLRNWDHE
eukprot:m.387101 g.387101  ORF g.387101 m.387101 type:complete len:91 (+) comp16750_c0_seq7:1460-1732(+)